MANADLAENTVVDSYEDLTRKISAHSNTIDALLEQYLVLLQVYTEEQARLQSAQQKINQHIARARFEGQSVSSDDYDGRMKASRLCYLADDTQDSKIEYTIKTTVSARKDEKSQQTFEQADTSEKSPHPKENNDPDEDDKQKENTKQLNPLHWFGAFATQPLKQAQIISVQTVEETIPKIVSTSAQMAGLEVEIRRARKWRGKLQMRLDRMKEG
ncbi:hypothetical protein GLAREA_09945 [Glarea lozoyensis ATCC 20868]|uniref:Vacuolar ATPase assembly protein VMA22 n=1 Tax=Glarea lozoyensis (strain ATCC 20868 / MF5171) TaxID=1116229 RepID=S3CV43_GLAL2|nr:uncharacterized protein GLAREA_09945 [Glarea lozoyensis ATCC 20868]EPE28824.1 hypothetical protein GLAREA_09945 [Glarea lozoyensis ATCC 20868]